MSKIRILPEILSNKIAAGEVIERPSSVVKELLENALDAYSSRIIIEVEKGGRQLIRVSDDGMGMNGDDALLSLERFATSKISKDQDLFSIGTLGFRGEALPSIASVSRFSLVTKDENSQAGIRILVEGGKIRNVSEVGAPKGTMVTVEQLFFNIPARRKFLKTIGTEMGHISDTVASIAIGWPEIQFRLLHNGKIVKDWPAVSDPLDRAATVLGKNLKDEFYKIRLSEKNLSVTGWISSPRISRSTSRNIYLHVNGRLVRDRTILHALSEGYKGRLMKGEYPLAVLFVNLPFDQVDVNIHPSKQEVRFSDQRNIHDAIIKIVAETLNLAGRPKWEPEKLPVQHLSQISEPLSDYGKKEKEIFLPPGKIDGHKIKEIQTKQEMPQQEMLWKKSFFKDLRVIGQLHNTYILCESGEGLILIDQHAAHERILFEQIKNNYISKNSKKRSQNLLLPETVDFGYREAGILEGLIPGLEELGMKVEPFGGNTFVIKSVPAIFADRETAPLLIEIVEKMAEIGFSPGIEFAASAADHCLILMACHGAIRANQHLSDKEITALLDQLDQCDIPSSCPHGRPTWIKWPIKFFEKSFKRVV